MAKLQTVVLMGLTTLLWAKTNALGGSFLQNRDAYYGGFSLNIDLTTSCPSGTYSCDYYNQTGSPQIAPCCPTSTVCNTGGVFCCPSSADCSQTVLQSPTCADPSWTLYTNGGGSIFCCPSGTFAQQGGICVTTSVTSNSLVDYFTSETQANNASPTGDGTASAPAGAAMTTTTDTAGAGATTTAATTTQAAGSSSIVQGSSATNSPTGSSTGSAASPSATKSAAAKTFAASSILVFMMILVHLIW